MVARVGTVDQRINKELGVESAGDRQAAKRAAERFQRTTKEFAPRGTPDRSMVVRRGEGGSYWGPGDSVIAQDYGARPSAVPPSLATQDKNARAMERALDAIGEGVLTIPPRDGEDYWCSSLPTLKRGQYIVGHGPAASRLRVQDPTVDGITIHGTSGDKIRQAGLRNLGIIGPETGTGIGLDIEWSVFGLEFTNLHIFGWGSHGARVEETYSVSWRDCTFDSNGGSGFYGLTNINQTTWDRCISVSNGIAGYQVIGGAGNTMIGCDAEYNGTYGVDWRYVHSSKILGGDLEENVLANIYFHWRGGAPEPAQMCTVDSVNITGGGVTPYGILMDGADQCRYRENYFGYHTADHVALTANSSRCGPSGPNSYVGTGTALNNLSGTAYGIDGDAALFRMETIGGFLVDGDLQVANTLNHDGTHVGFFGVVPQAQGPANPDTSGASLAVLEGEVNQMKALLRSYGLLPT